MTRKSVDSGSELEMDSASTHQLVTLDDVLGVNVDLPPPWNRGCVGGYGTFSKPNESPFVAGVSRGCGQLPGGAAGQARNSFPGMLAAFDDSCPWWTPIHIEKLVNRAMPQVPKIELSTSWRIDSGRQDGSACEMAGTKVGQGFVCALEGIGRDLCCDGNTRCDREKLFRIPTGQIRDGSQNPLLP